ncbi:hypothetical protein AVEN_108427-1 [Araneus ventricosus]|uniref:Uncharacterized protein n=1 Tax=Araneus ventricosus TaxID=182803 RepID=A0A4Y2T2R7_ARAVE|nr:hypothetical protein AVEN_72589-1 [Araneus ventricosus]GBN94908.1 hypothetical protein AVEN_108427-1 [Araneus ventricosus]
MGPESHRECVGHVRKTDCRSQCAAWYTPRALLQEWALLPQQVINGTIASMPRRCLPVLGCRAATAVIYVFLFVFALLFDMWSSNATPTSNTTFTHIH